MDGPARVAVSKSARMSSVQREYESAIAVPRHGDLGILNAEATQLTSLSVWKMTFEMEEADDERLSMMKG